MRTLMLAAVAAFTLSAPALAVSAVTTPGALGATDFIDWAQFGPDSVGQYVPKPVTSDGGGSAEVMSAGGSLVRYTQGVSWGGNFVGGEALLFTNFLGPDITIVFAAPVAGAGTQWQANSFGAFGANLKAYDSADTLLGTVTRDGLSTNASDGSAIFLGVLSTEANISKIVLTLDYASNNSNEFAINRLLLTGTPGGGGAVVPEPATWAMLVAGFGMVGFLARRRRLAHAA